MKQPSRLLPGVLALLFIAGCGGSKAGIDASRRDLRSTLTTIDHALASTALSHAIWGVHVVDLSTGRTLLERNPDVNLVPASNTKLFTTAAALELLGPAYRFETTVQTDGYIADDTLRGSLIVRGSGDPTIGGRFHNGDAVAVFRDWAIRLRAMGITHIAGDIIGDDDAFDELPLGFGWSWDDEPYAYSAEVSALSFNDNTVEVIIRPGNPGKPGDLSWGPLQTDFVSIANGTLTVDHDSLSGTIVTRDRAGNNFTLRSRVAVGDDDKTAVSVSNPTEYFVYVLRDVFLVHGIGVDGRAIDIDDLDGEPSAKRTTLLRQVSPELREIINVINKRSMNLYAEQVLRALGTLLPPDQTTEPGGSARNGLNAAATVWTAAGVDTSIAQLVDGSGLSRYNLVTPRMITALLRYMWTRPTEIKQAFLDSLPVGGVDGTLSARYRGAPAQGRVRAKTGSVSNVSTLGGYVTTSDGTPLAFSLMCNNFIVDTDDVRDIQDIVVNALAEMDLR